MATKNQSAENTGGTTDDTNAQWEAWVRGIVADEFNKQNAELIARIEALETNVSDASEQTGQSRTELADRITALENAKPSDTKGGKSSKSDGDRLAKLETLLGVNAEPIDRAPEESRKTGNTSIDEKTGAMIASDARDDLKQKVALTSDQLQNLDKRNPNSGEPLAQVDEDTQAA